jgi:hypothetical protein
MNRSLQNKLNDLKYEISTKDDLINDLENMNNKLINSKEKKNSKKIKPKSTTMNMN